MKLKQIVLLSAMLLNYFLPTVAADHEEDRMEEANTNEDPVRELERLLQEAIEVWQSRQECISLLGEVNNLLNYLRNTQAGRALPNSQQEIDRLIARAVQLPSLILTQEEFLQRHDARISTLMSQLRPLQQRQPMNEDN